MSAESLGTGSGSSSTLVRGCDLASMPINELVGVKNEPADSEEMEIRAHMQAGCFWNFVQL